MEAKPRSRQLTEGMTVATREGSWRAEAVEAKILMDLFPGYG